MCAWIISQYLTSQVGVQLSHCHWPPPGPSISHHTTPTSPLPPPIPTQLYPMTEEYNLILLKTNNGTTWERRGFIDRRAIYSFSPAHYSLIDTRAASTHVPGWLPFPPSEDRCGERYIKYEVGGEIRSPGYPGPYPEKVECTWMIRVQNDQKIILNFIDLDLDDSS